VDDGKVTVYAAGSTTGFDPRDGEDWGQLSVSTAGAVDVTVGLGEVFVLGDNRANSRDSRELGTIRSDQIVGKVVRRIYPLNQSKSL
jgi:signal peptidase I